MTLEEMRKRKEQMGYSNAQLSNLSGVPLGTLNKILSGATKHPRHEAVMAIERVLCDTTYHYGYVSAAPFLVREEAVDYKAGQKGQGDYTIEDYYALPEEHRAELIDGVFYDMAAPSVVHQRIAGTFFYQVSCFIRERNGSCIPMISPVDVRLGSDNKTMVQPDVVVLCDEKKLESWGINGAPDFVLEVVSPSSTSRDYVKKAGKYLDAGVREYWIIDPMKRRVVAYDFADDGTPYIRGLEGSLGLCIFDRELQIDLGELGMLIKTKD